MRAALRTRSVTEMIRSISRAYYNHIVRQSLLVLVAACAAHSAPKTPLANHAPAELRDPPGVFEVEDVEADGAGFNQGRPYVVSVNSKIPGSRRARAKMANQVVGQLDQIVWEWFGDAAPDHIVLDVGAKVPIEL